MTMRLGEGIAKSVIETPATSYLQVSYVPEEDSVHLLRGLGRAIHELESWAVSQSLAEGQIALCGGSIWKKESRIAKLLFSPMDLYELRMFINRGDSQPGLRSLSQEDSGKFFLVKTSLSANKDLRHEVWTAINPQDNQTLVDGLFCLHFDQSAYGTDGQELTQEEIAAVVSQVGYMFAVDQQGKVLLPEITVR